MGKNDMRLGQRVTLIIDGASGYIPGDIKKRNGESFRISKIHRFKPNNKYYQRIVYYELEGLCSVWGVPYSIPGDWLFSMDEGATA